MSNQSSRKIVIIGIAREAWVNRKGMWVVLVDMNCGKPPADWSPNSVPKKLSEALDESDVLRKAGWITKIEPY